MNQECTRTQEWTRNGPGVHQDSWGSVKCWQRLKMLNTALQNTFSATVDANSAVTMTPIVKSPTTLKVLEFLSIRQENTSTFTVNHNNSNSASIISSKGHPGNQARNPQVTQAPSLPLVWPWLICQWLHTDEPA